MSENRAREDALDKLSKERCLARERSPFPADFHAGWEAAVEWAEEYGEFYPMVRWFVEAEASALEAQRLAAEPDVGDQGQLND